MNRIKGMNKFLTFYILALFIFADLSFSSEPNVNLEKHATHLRLNIIVQKEQIEIENLVDGVYLKTLNVEVYEKVKKLISEITFDKKYVADVTYSDATTKKDSVSSIKFQLASKDVELFSFYQDMEGKYILDFWKNSDEVDLQKTAVVKSEAKEVISNINPSVNEDASQKKKDEGVKVEVLPKENTSLPGQVTENIKAVTKQTVDKARPAPAVSTQTNESITLFKNEKDYRDFRYGASFLWDYSPLLPQLKETIDVKSKTAEYLYPIKDREAFDKDPIETHLQLNINLYRQKKWGLMHKSIDLFNQKYPKQSAIHADMLEFMKANALLMNNMKNKEVGLEKMAINMYKTISQRTDIYPFKKALYIFLISYYFHNDEAVLGLQSAKKYYVLTLENFDREDSVYAAEAILYFLAKLNQIETITEFIEEKTTIKILPPQIMLAYKLYTLLKLGNNKDVIKFFEKEQKSLVKPVHPVIIYNVAEAYFRTAVYDKALALYDEFLAMYSHYHESGRVRLRKALAYELLEKNIDETLDLYKNAINLNADMETLYEAKIRYVALQSVRKRNLTAQDKEVRVFLEKSDSDKFEYSPEVNKLLWLVRLRSFIVDGKFQEALSYLSAIPISFLSLNEQRVFEGDGAEVVYGILFELYRGADYSKVLKVWEIYKEKYIAKVAMDPYLNFMVGSSYIKLGLFRGFDRLYADFEKIKNSPEKTFPTWNEREQGGDSKLMLLELKVISNYQLGNYNEVKKYLAEYERISPLDKKLNYYRGMLNYKLKDYKLTAKNLEEYLSTQTSSSVFDASEVSQMLRAYADSLYELNMLDKFKKVAKAILTDTDNYAAKNEFMISLRERVSYLLVEMLNADNKQLEQLGESIDFFKKNFKESIYMSRINYLHAMSLLRNNQEAQAQKLLEQLIKDDKASDYIRELAKSELSLIKIKNRTL